MSMKTILVPMEYHDGMHSLLETALLLARRHDSYVEGFSVHWGTENFALGDMLNAIPIEQYRHEVATQAQRARQTFVNFMQKNEMPRSITKMARVCSGRSSKVGLRPLDQGRLHTQSIEANDIRRRNSTHYCECTRACSPSALRIADVGWADIRYREVKWSDFFISRSHQYTDFDRA